MHFLSSGEATLASMGESKRSPGDGYGPTLWLWNPGMRVVPRTETQGCRSREENEAGAVRKGRGKDAHQA